MNLMYSYLIDCSDIDQRLLNICIIQISAILRHIQSYQHLQSHFKWSAYWNRLKVKTFKQAYSTERIVHSRLFMMQGKRIKISRRNGLFGHGWTRGPDWNSVMSRWHSRLNRFILIIAEEESQVGVENLHGVMIKQQRTSLLIQEADLTACNTRPKSFQTCQ